MDSIDKPIDSLEVMFNLQKGLLAKYKIIENLPDFPIDLNSRKGQHLIRDFIGRYTEELSEAYEEAMLASTFMECNQPGNAKVCILRFNEEIADANHFLLEILIYSNISYRDLESMCYINFNKRGLQNLHSDNNPIQSLLKLGKFLNSRINIDQSVLYTVFSIQEGLQDPMKCAGRRISSSLVGNTYCRYLWEIVNSLNVARSLLKNKDWKKEDSGVNEMMYKEKIFDTITKIFQFYDLIGLTEMSILGSYIRKNDINLQRIKNNY